MLVNPGKTRGDEQKFYDGLQASDAAPWWLSIHGKGETWRAAPAAGRIPRSRCFLTVPMKINHLVDLGDAQRKSKDFQAAILHYLKALEQDPGHGRALLGLADAYRGTQDAGKAIAVLERYLDRNPRDAAALTRLADAYRKTGRRAPAEDAYRKALDLDPRNRHALMGLGDLYHRDQRYRDALVPWERLLEIDPSLLNILTMVGHMHRKQLDFEQAAQCFARALAMAPHNPHAVFGLADSLRGLGRFAEAAPYSGRRSWGPTRATSRCSPGPGTATSGWASWTGPKCCSTGPWTSATTSPPCWAWRGSTSSAATFRRP